MGVRRVWWQRKGELLKSLRFGASEPGLKLFWQRQDLQDWMRRLNVQVRREGVILLSLRADTGRTGADETRAQARAEVDELQQVQLAGPFPIGEPRSFGPGGVVALLASVEGPGVRAQESLEHAVLQDHPEDARLGMRPGERLVMEKMRDLLRDLFDQNQRLIEQQHNLQGRVDKIEDDALNPTMHSASSGGQRDQLDALRSFVDLPVGGWVPPEGYNLGRYVPAKERVSLDYHEGLEEGFRRAMQLLHHVMVELP